MLGGLWRSVNQLLVADSVASHILIQLTGMVRGGIQLITLPFMNNLMSKGCNACSILKSGKNFDIRARLQNMASADWDPYRFLNIAKRGSTRMTWLARTSSENGVHGI